MSSELRGQAVTPDATLVEDYTASPRGDILGGLLFLAWAAFGWLSVLTSPGLFTVRGGDPGPALLPVSVLVVLTIGGLAVVAGGLRRRVSHGAETPSDGSLGHPLVTGIFIVSLIALPTIMQLVGFALTTALWVATWVFVLVRSSGATNKSSALLAVIGSGTITSVVYLVFVTALRVRLPGV